MVRSVNNYTVTLITVQFVWFFSGQGNYQIVWSFDWERNTENGRTSWLKSLIF